jgi:hypothetical protein
VNETTEITAEEARKVLEEAKRNRLEQCQAAISAALDKHGCQLICQLRIIDGKIVSDVVLGTRE